MKGKSVSEERTAGSEGDQRDQKDQEGTKEIRRIRRIRRINMVPPCHRAKLAVPLCHRELPLSCAPKCPTHLIGRAYTPKETMQSLHVLVPLPVEQAVEPLIQHTLRVRCDQLLFQYVDKRCLRTLVEIVEDALALV